jgi:8-oxo-dGTP pyrophosphatase MutT (NUDIX family)
MTALEWHLARALRLDLPGDYVGLRLGAASVGLLRPQLAARLAAQGFTRSPDGAVVVADAAGLVAAQDALAAAGVFRKRGELFDVMAADGAVLGQVDRGALPVLGIAAQGVHVNGLVQGPAGLSLWVAHRSPAKLLDAGKLDHIVAGGICAGMDAAGTLLKEAEEEASVPAALAAEARLVGRLRYAMARPEGLRRDRLWCYDLVLPADFTPVPRDGEVERFELMPIEDVIARVRETEDFKFNVTLVLIDLFARLGLVPAGEMLGRLREG